ncbi:unnamed protein product [Owenia fusiformis]|uniref:Hexosyltransferase n=1 Tax=Owenia fusiformis TaxID=6347 RepID=A0A8J1UHA1_OWEFU|nr:unnamed protein product [Owenia fusiformis]
MSATESKDGGDAILERMNNNQVMGIYGTRKWRFLFLTFALIIMIYAFDVLLDLRQFAPVGNHRNWTKFGYDRQASVHGRMKCKQFTAELPNITRERHALAPDAFYNLVFNNTYLDEIEFIHKAHGICDRENVGEFLFMVKLISDATETAASFRHAIRKTWGSVRKRSRWSIRVVFAIGQTENTTRTNAIDKESRRYGDIVQGTSADSYLKLADKTIMSFRWQQEYCSNAMYVFHGTHDIVVNMDKLIAWVDDFYLHNTSSERVYFGYPMFNPRILHEGIYKLYSPVQWPAGKYPFYHPGHGIIYSMSFIRQMNAMFCRTPITNPDDCYLGAIAEAMGAKEYYFRNFHADYNGKINKNVVYLHLGHTGKMKRNETEMYEWMAEIYNGFIK